MAEVHQAVLPVHEEPSGAEVKCFNPCRDCKSQSYCRRHGCQSIKAEASPNNRWRCTPCNYGCTDHCLVNAILLKEEIAPEIMSRQCKCGLSVKWCQYPACGAKSCISFDCSEQFILIQETPVVASGCQGCPNWRVCIQYGCVKKGNALQKQTITCGPKCGRCGEAKTYVDGAWICTNPLCR